MPLYPIAYNEPNESKREAIEERILKNHADEQVRGMIEADRRQRSKVWKPFELAFMDAVSGRAVDMKQFRGKVVVVGF